MENIILRKKVVILGDSPQLEAQRHLFSAVEDGNSNIKPTASVHHFTTDIQMAEGNKLELELWDTTVMEDFDRLSPLNYADIDVILLCFAIDKPETLETAVKQWHPVARLYCPRAPIILVGNRNNLRDDPNIIQMLRENDQKPISKKVGRQAATTMNALAYLECPEEKSREDVILLLEKAIKASQEKSGKCEKCTIL